MSINKNIFPILIWALSSLIGLAIHSLYIMFLMGIDWLAPIRYLTFSPISTIVVFLFWYFAIPYGIKKIPHNKISEKEDAYRYGIQMAGTHLFFDFTFNLFFVFGGIIYFSHLAPWIGYVFLYWFTKRNVEKLNN
jgi:hypothetical protein